jgi:D-arginine dehydrogenase
MIYDVAIVGGGIAGASLAAELAPQLKVLLLEGEDQPGYHSTGRSNALWHATYGGPQIVPLTMASGPWLQSPPEEIAQTGFLRPRGGLIVGRADERYLIDAFMREFAESGVPLDRLSGALLRDMIPGLRPNWTDAVLEVDCEDIDVARLHAAYLASARRNGVTLMTRSPLQAAVRESGIWALSTLGACHSAHTLVNAAGAWAERVAEMAGAKPVGITPYRRTIVQLRLAIDVSPDLPFLIDASSSVYFRPEGRNRVWLSPQDETPSPACDVAPDELDIAIAIDRFQQLVDWPIAAVEHSWAGLRSFAPDRLPVFGFDPDCSGFFWCAGQGGFGIQTAPAAAKLCAALLTGNSRDPMVADIDAEIYAPSRFA